MQENKNTDSGSHHMEQNVNQEGDMYEILNPSIFRAMLIGRDDVITEKMERVDGEMVYTISDEEFIKTCVCNNIIQKSRDARAERITSPEDLINRITSIERRIYGEGSEYYITTKRGTVCFSSGEMVKIGAWKIKLMEGMKYLITFPGRAKGGAGDLDDVIMYVMENAVVSSEEKRTEKEMMGDIIMARLMRLPIVLAKEDYVGNKVVLDDGEMFVASSTTVHEIVREVGYFSTTLIEVGGILDEYRGKPNSQKMRMGIRISEWYFNRWGGEE